jgi:hypothetical protein
VKRCKPFPIQWETFATSAPMEAIHGNSTCGNAFASRQRPSGFEKHVLGKRLILLQTRQGATKEFAGGPSRETENPSAAC